MHAIGFGDLCHGGGVELQVLVVRGAVRKVGGVLEVFVSDGGQEDDARFPFPVIRCEMFFEVFVEGLFEVIEPAFAFERFVEAPVGEDDVGVEIGSGVVSDLGFADGGGEASWLHVQEVLGGGDFIAARVEVHFIGSES